MSGAGKGVCCKRANLGPADTGSTPGVLLPWKIALGERIRAVMTKILLAEDDSSMREYLQRALQRVGYQVEAVGCGTEALPFLEREQFDLLLTDIVMPEMDGIELAQKASAIDPNI